MNSTQTPARAFFGIRFPENEARVIDAVFERTKLFHERPIALGLNVDLDDEHCSDCRLLSSLFPSKKMMNSKNLVYISSINNDLTAKISAFFANTHKEEDDTIDIVGIPHKTWIGTSGTASRIKSLHKKKMLIHIPDSVFLNIDTTILKKMIQEHYRNVVDYVEIVIGDQKTFFENTELRERIKIFKDNGVTVVFSGRIHTYGLAKMESLVKDFPTLSIMAHKALITNNVFDISAAREFYKRMIEFERNN